MKVIIWKTNLWDFIVLQDGRKLGYGSMQGIPMIASSPGMEACSVLYICGYSHDCPLSWCASSQEMACRVFLSLPTFQVLAMQSIPMIASSPDMEASTVHIHKNDCLLPWYESLWRHPLRLPALPALQVRKKAGYPYNCQNSKDGKSQSQKPSRVSGSSFLYQYASP